MSIQEQTYYELTYTDLHRAIVERGRGSDTAYGNIDDLNPEKYNEQQMYSVSWERQ